ncbi:TonB-dependent receptor [uncultured Capnocytophaga sp.]|uniref:TonB-dependent receptor plug domain-containing protein n=1 Tax=uncultured Capnocytophaga sp. TaxID=159273 RepID=UPI00262A8762|nr:TonB-dependent receptor [uncultured Capnocytophaga sp.]
MKTVLLLTSIFLNSYALLAQKDTLDSKKIIKLDDVVVSAQIEPQSIKKSIKNVQVISEKQIKSLGATNLGDVLNQYVNITVMPDGDSGRSTVSLFGLDASYFKVLVDNVPLVNEGGVGNNTDLSQINLDDIERIEIIEGAMGVTHGANAITGILNIITKRHADNKWNLTYSLQEESVGKEYNLTTRGRHIQNFKASHNLNDHWMFSIGTTRNKFNGFLGNYNGKYVLYNDQNRGYRFLPRNYLQTNAVINYKKERFNTFYKFELMNQDISFYDRSIKSGYNDQWGRYKFGNDRRYFYKRQFHHLNINGSGWLNYNFSLSYQEQTRDDEYFRYIISRRLETNNTTERVEAMKVGYSKGELSKSFYDRKLALSIGYEATKNKGFAVVNAAQNRTKEVNESIDNYDGFLVSEYHFTPNFSMGLGGRYSFQSLFENQYSFSIGARYLLPENLEWRTSVGRSYRTPDFYELFSNIIFEGHYFLGNENLTPESSLSFDTSLKKITLFCDDLMMKNQLSLSHNRIKDRITNALIGYEGSTPKYQNINISKYNYINLASTNAISLDENLEANIGASFTWISQIINNNVHKTDDRYLLNMGINAGLTYTLPKWGTSVSGYYKWAGKSQLWAATTNGYIVSEVDPYGWLDASIKQPFLGKKLELTLGARNLLDITDVKRTLTTEGHNTSSSVLLGYGRTFFLKLTYNLDINY